MKTSKLFSVLAVSAALAFSLCLGANVHAAVGDVAGEYYSTDIVAYVDNMAIPSYNIGGKTVIVAEELADYGFEVTWDGENRLLNVKTADLPKTPPQYVPQKAAPNEVGKAVGKYYETDIVCYVNGMWVESYNIGGRTVAVVEDMASQDDAAKQNSRDGNVHRALGYSYSLMRCHWSEDERWIRLYALRPGSRVEIPGGDAFILSDTPFMRYAYQSSAWNLYDGSLTTAPLVTGWLNYIHLNDSYYVPILDESFLPGMTVALQGNTIAVDFYKNADGNHIIPTYLYERAATSGSCYNILLEPDLKLSVFGKEIECDNPVAYIYSGDVYVNITAIHDAVSDKGELLRYKYALPDGLSEKRDDILYTSTLLFINGRQITPYDSGSGKLYVAAKDLEAHGFRITVSPDGKKWEITSPAAPIPLTEFEKSLHPENYERPNNRSRMFDVYDGIYDVTINGKPIGNVYIGNCTQTNRMPCLDIVELAEACGFRVESSYQNGYIYRVFTH